MIIGASVFSLLLFSSPSVLASPSMLEGNWRMIKSNVGSHDCEGVNTSICGWNSQSRENEMRFRDSVFERVVIGYTDTQKRIPSWMKQVVGKFQALAIPKDGSLALDIAFESVKLTALNAQTANSWNRIAFCGKKNWKGSITQTVTGLMCEPLPMRIPGSVYFTTVATKNSLLYMADDSGQQDGSSPEKRATKLNFNSPWRRIP